jgi:hypothetical protein
MGERGAKKTPGGTFPPGAVMIGRGQSYPRRAQYPGIHTRTCTSR